MEYDRWVSDDFGNEMKTGSAVASSSVSPPLFFGVVAKYGFAFSGSAADEKHGGRTYCSGKYP